LSSTTVVATDGSYRQDRLAEESARASFTIQSIAGMAPRSQRLAAAQYPLVVLADGDNQFDLGEPPQRFGDWRSIT
jgi:hypothetical protein